MARFYPEFFPTFEHEPTTDKFAIQRVSDGVGEGVVALVDFEPGEIVFRFTGIFSAEITQFTLQVNDHLHLHDPFFMGKILHSCDPNCTVDMETRTFTAIRPIKAGDFVTMDYAQTEARLFRSFECSCGAANCRGYITGYAELIQEAS
ncbi:MAG: SET domain-containing protein-lysine N-methyltransferase [Phototrophicales bacterium]|nr:MAG: SET domain-containing protein-lysine N-methyltransferase [Phototrophicales bacterium]